jgi:hypothetical protein
MGSCRIHFEQEHHLRENHQDDSALFSDVLKTTDVPPLQVVYFNAVFSVRLFRTRHPLN